MVRFRQGLCADSVHLHCRAWVVILFQNRRERQAFILRSSPSLVFRHQIRPCSAKMAGLRLGKRPCSCPRLAASRICLRNRPKKCIHPPFEIFRRGDTHGHIGEYGKHLSIQGSGGFTHNGLFHVGVGKSGETRLHPHRPGGGRAFHGMGPYGEPAGRELLGAGRFLA